MISSDRLMLVLVTQDGVSEEVTIKAQDWNLAGEVFSMRQRIGVGKKSFWN